jgi:hypothetical protein
LKLCRRGLAQHHTFHYDEKGIGIKSFKESFAGFSILHYAI